MGLSVSVSQTGKLHPLLRPGPSPHAAPEPPLCILHSSAASQSITFHLYVFVFLQNLVGKGIV